MNPEKQKTEVYEIPVVNAMRLFSEVDKMNKKAMRNSLVPIVYQSEGEPYQREASPGKRPEIVVKVRVMYQIIKLGDWSLIGVIDHVTAAGNILRVVPGLEMPQRYWNAGPNCDHCKTNRRRNETVVVEKDGEFRQLGKQCVQLYLGIDPRRAFLALEFTREVIERFGEAVDPDWMPVNERPVVNRDQYLECVCSCIRNNGYISRRAAREGGPDEESTADMALDLYIDSIKKKRDDVLQRYKINEEDGRIAKEAIAWIGSHEPENQFWHSLKNVVMGLVIHVRNIGFAAAGVQAYLNHFEKREKVKAGKASEWQGTPGEKVEWRLEVVKKIGLESYHYTFRTMYIFVDKEGNGYKWISSSNHDLNVGEWYTLRAKVKEHAVYKDAKQTVITNCKVVGDVGVWEVIVRDVEELKYVTSNEIDLSRNIRKALGVRRKDVISAVLKDTDIRAII